MVTKKKTKKRPGQTRRSNAHEELESGPPYRPIPKGALEYQLDRVRDLAQEMCGGLGISNIEEWQTWVYRVIEAAKAGA
jgi:hypothetical protein